MISFLFADDAPVYRDITETFFKEHLQDYDIFISDVVMTEIQKTNDAIKRAGLLDAVKTYQLRLYGPLNAEINDLAEAYIQQNVIPKSKMEDALHVAFATFYEFDILLSWNFKHLANIKKQIQLNAVNQTFGYIRGLSLLNPMEVICEK